MRRRALLAGLTTIGTLSGCIGSGSPFDDENEFECEQGDSGAGVSIDGYPGIDEPPQDIRGREEMEEDDWDDHYLGNCMDSEPSVPFEVINGYNSRLREEYRHPRDEEYLFATMHSVLLARSADELAEISHEPPSEVAEIDFENSVILVFQVGLTGVNREPRWVRVESVEDGVHAYGYSVLPYLQEDDSPTVHTSWIIVDVDGDDVERAIVSYTGGREQRVNFTNEDGIVKSSELD